METVKCACGKDPITRTAKTEKNFNRRFRFCPDRPPKNMQPVNLQRGKKKAWCDYWEWIDPEICERSVEVTPDLLSRLDEIEDENTELRNTMMMLEEKCNLLEEKCNILQSKVESNEVCKSMKDNELLRAGSDRMNLEMELRKCKKVKIILIWALGFILLGVLGSIM